MFKAIEVVYFIANLLALILLLVGFATNFWAECSNIHFGLFKHCVESGAAKGCHNTEDILTSKDDMLLASKFLLAISLILIGVQLLICAIVFFCCSIIGRAATCCVVGAMSLSDTIIIIANLVAMGVMRGLVIIDVSTCDNGWSLYMVVLVTIYKCLEYVVIGIVSCLKCCC